MNGLFSNIGLLLPGLWTTLELTASSLLIGMPLAVALAVLLQSHRRWLTRPAIVLIEILRGMPALITLYFVYYGFPSAGIVLNDTVAISVAFGLTFVAYTAPILSASIALVPREHIEAAETLGLTWWTVRTKVVLPQAVRVALPPLISWTVILFQGTALASVVGATDLFARATSLGAQTYAYTYYILLASALYAAVSIPLLALAAALQRRRDVPGARSLLRSLVHPARAAATPARPDSATPQPVSPLHEGDL